MPQETGWTAMHDHPDIAVTIEPGAAGLGRRAALLAEELALPLVEDAAAAEATLLLMLTAAGLELREAASPATRGACVDFTAIDLRTGAGNLSRRQPLARAIGRASRTVLDATAGLGHDAALLACMGYSVTAVERSPVVAALLQDGLNRALADERFRQALSGRLRVIVADARAVLMAMDEPPDAVYIDPMFPPKRKASALAKKSIRLLRQVVGDDEDAGELLQKALDCCARRVVVKRPTHARPLGSKPAASIAGKLARYDVYTPGSAAQR
jgi:16S rRNA (guanine1516-N2)-methyltransferase